MGKGKVRMPSSSGGIVQYFEDSFSKLSISPKQLIFVSIVFIILVLIFHWTNPFGF